MMAGKPVEAGLGFVAAIDPEDLALVSRDLDDESAAQVADHVENYFRLKAHDGQMPPEGNWRIWLIMAGRGFGKTRAGAEWVKAVAEADPQARIALVGATLGDARSVMVEGESGIIACCSPEDRPVFEPSLRRLRFPNGAEATLYSAGEPESLRGPQFSHAPGSGSERILCEPGARDSRCDYSTRD